MGVWCLTKNLEALSCNSVQDRSREYRAHCLVYLRLIIVNLSGYLLHVYVMPLHMTRSLTSSPYTLAYWKGSNTGGGKGSGTRLCVHQLVVLWMRVFVHVCLPLCMCVCMWLSICTCLDLCMWTCFLFKPFVFWDVLKMVHRNILCI